MNRSFLNKASIFASSALVGLLSFGCSGTAMDNPSALNECSSGLGKVLIVAAGKENQPPSRGKRIDEWISKCQPKADFPKIRSSIEKIYKEQAGYKPLMWLVVIPPEKREADTQIEIEFLTSFGTPIASSVMPFKTSSKKDYYLIGIDEVPKQPQNAPVPQTLGNGTLIATVTPLTHNYQFYKDIAFLGVKANQEEQ